MDPEQRRWWRLLDDLPDRLGQVHRWTLAGCIPRPQRCSIHPNPTTVVCLSGTLRIERQDGVVCDLHAGEALLIAAGVAHQHAPFRPGAIGFAQGFLPAWSDVRLGGHTRDWSGRLPSEPSRQLVDRALACADSQERTRLFSDVIRQVLSESVTDHHFAAGAMRAMVSRLWNGIHTGVTVADLVAASGLSRAQAYRLFRAGYGVPPKEALMQSRLWLAGSLLDAGLPLAEVAARSGFPSAATCSRAWKRAHGRAPRPAAKRSGNTRRS